MMRVWRGWDIVMRMERIGRCRGVGELDVGVSGMVE